MYINYITMTKIKEFCKHRLLNGQVLKLRGIEQGTFFTTNVVTLATYWSLREASP